MIQVEVPKVQTAEESSEAYDPNAFNFAELANQAISQASIPDAPLHTEPRSRTRPSKKCTACQETSSRDYTSIDSAARRFSLSWLLSLSNSIGTTIREGLEKLGEELEAQIQNGERTAFERAAAKNEYDRHYDDYVQTHHTWSEKVRHAKALSIDDEASPDEYFEAARAANAFKSSILDPSKTTMTYTLNAWLSARSCDECTASRISSLSEARRDAPVLLARNLLKLSGIDPQDSTCKARFIYTWLSTSLHYDALDHVSSLPSTARTPVDTLLRGSEQCHGFVNLFKTMFDASRAPNAARSLIVHGACRRADGSIGVILPTGIEEVDLERDLIHGHAWNAFPVDGGEGGGEEAGEYKLIDVTWGAPMDGGFDASWFDMSNEEFGERHFPSRRQRFVADDDGDEASFRDYQFREDGRAWRWEEWVGFGVSVRLSGKPKSQCFREPARHIYHNNVMTEMS